jgi:hypothetical protein
MDCNEQSIPLALDLVDTWASGTTFTGKAVRVKLGTPGQEVLLFPAFTQDDLHVHNRSVQYIEQPLTPLDLDALGDYDWTQSSTFSLTNLSSWNGTSPNRDPTRHSPFNDALEIDNKLSLDGFPMFTALEPRGYCECTGEKNARMLTSRSSRQLALELLLRAHKLFVFDGPDSFSRHWVLARNSRSSQ